MKTETVKGFNDYSGDESAKRAKIKKIIVAIFEKYGFEPVETPIIEYEEFVKSENQSDEVISDIFKLKDKGNRKLALRYEFTFQLKRLIKNKKLPYKRYQIGEVFRDEPVSKSRLRQFTQCDVDIIGSNIRDEAEILAVTSEILEKLGIKPIILVNNRKLLNEILESQGIKSDKEQVLREIDKIDKLGEKQVKVNLKKLKADGVLNDLKKGEKFFGKFESYKEILELITYCRNYGIKILFSPSIVRGLSYYDGNIFEIKTKGIRETIVGGGSYMLNKVQATGISFGLERLSSLAKIKLEKEKILVWPNGKDREAVKIAKKLRKQGSVCDVIYKDNMKKVFEYANVKKFSKIIFYDKKIKKFKVRDLKTGKESYKL